MRCLWRSYNPVFAGLLGFVHGFIGAFDHCGLGIVRQHLGDAGAEGDEHLLVIVKEEFFGQFTLQAGQGD